MNVTSSNYITRCKVQEAKRFIVKTHTDQNTLVRPLRNTIALNKGSTAAVKTKAHGESTDADRNHTQVMHKQARDLPTVLVTKRAAFKYAT